MTTIEDLLWRPAAAFVELDPSLNPFLVDELLQETQLIDARTHAVSSTVALLLELRSSLQFDTGNAAVLVVRGATDLQWRSAQRSTDRTAWSVVGTEIRATPGEIRVDLSFFPDAALRVRGTGAEFSVVAVDGLDETPPDYEADLATVRQGLPQWDRSCTVLGASTVR